MYKLLLVSIMGLLLVACSDENMEKWKEMNKDRIEETPKEDPNLPTVKGDVDAVKKKIKDINEAVKSKVNDMLEKEDE